MPRPIIGRAFVMSARSSVIGGDVARKILDAVRDGAKQGAAAEAGGITREWLNKALARGRKDPASIYGTFAQDYAEAQIAAQRNAIAEYKKKFAAKSRA
jgi:hypothetical protein